MNEVAGLGESAMLDWRDIDSSLSRAAAETVRLNRKGRAILFSYWPMAGQSRYAVRGGRVRGKETRETNSQKWLNDK